MKKTLLTLVIVAISVVTFAQKHNIVNASIALRNQNFVEAKQYIDEAYNNESTLNEAKMWNYRSKIYLEIAKQHKELDSEAILKATEAHLKCIQKDKKGRVIVRKWTAEEDVLTGLVNCGVLLFNFATEMYNNGSYKSSIAYYQEILNVLPFDLDDQFKRRNITNETIYMRLYMSLFKMKDYLNAKSYLQKLIDNNYNDPKVYQYMSNIYVEEGNHEKALEYLSQGREMFEDDQQLINDEINMYIRLNRKDELIAKLTKALEKDPENEVLLDIRGTVYYNSDDFTYSEKDFRALLDINPNSFNANSILASILINNANILIEKSNKTSNNSLYEKYRIDSDVILRSSLPYLEKAFNIDSKNKINLEMLKQIYYKLGHYKKSSEIKKIIEDLN